MPWLARHAVPGGYDGYGVRAGHGGHGAHTIIDNPPKSM